MARIFALYVEDEDGPDIDRFGGTIAAAGFEVVRAWDAAEVEAILAVEGGPFFDLVVIDRNIPATGGAVADTAVGDALFDSLVSRMPDRAFILLTGYADQEHVVHTLQRPNMIALGPGTQVQQIQHYTKSNTLEFASAVHSLGEQFRATEDISLEGEDIDLPNRRLLKRVAQDYLGSSIRARSAPGGLSETPVWICEVFAADGRALSLLVVKVMPAGSQGPRGGFMASVRPQMAAPVTHMVSGGCAGVVGSVAPLAGRSAVPLQDAIRLDLDVALNGLGSVLSELARQDVAPRSIPLHELVAPFIAWEKAEEVAALFHVDLPRAEIPAPIRYGCLHGDLHPGNVLIVDDRPVFIDFDNQCDGSRLADVFSLALGAVFHKSGALRDSPPSSDSLTSLLKGCLAPCHPWLDACAKWWRSEGYSGREFWGGLLGYALRQLKYPDVVKRPDLVELARAVAVLAAEEFAES